MQQRFVKLLTILGALTLMWLVTVVAATVYMVMAKHDVPNHTILELDLEKSLVEDIPDDPVAQFMYRDTLSTTDLVFAIEQAGTDPRVEGLLARVGTNDWGVAQTQEIRDAIIAFRNRGKPAIAFSETLGDGASSDRMYFLATAFDEIWLQPSGDVNLMGLSATAPFFRGTLDKLGIVPRLDHRKEYKNAMNTFTEKAFTPAHREATLKFVTSISEQFVHGIAAAQKRSEAEVRALMSKGPYYGDEAVKAGLVTGLAYREDVVSKLKAKVGPASKLLYVESYLQRAGTPYNEGPTIALIYGVGAVNRGESNFDPMNQELSMGADTISTALRDAINDPGVKAIVFRLDSPGGSYVASDTIWQATLEAKKKNKPLIVSMGNVAGSGGYFVAIGADKIVAEPGTLTGSIGVFGGKMVTLGLWNKLGVTFDHVQTTDRANMYDALTDFTPAQWQRLQASLDRVYDDFTSKVAAGRKLDREKVQDIAKGRIWSGEDAKAIGLVDELGGLTTALKLARQAAKLADNAPITVTTFPLPKPWFERLLPEKPESSEPATQATLAALRAARPLLQMAAEAGLTSGDRMLRMPPVLVY